MPKSNILIRTKIKQGMILFENQQFHEAEVLFENIAKTAKLNPDVWEMLGKICLNLGKSEKSINHFNKALEINPKNHEVWYLLGHALLKQQQPDKAIICFEKTLQNKPDYLDAHSILGIGYASKGRLTDAAIHFRKAIELKPDHTDSYCNLANILMDQGHINNAASIYKDILKVNPKLSSVHSNLLLSMNYQTNVDPETIYHAHREWGRLHEWNASNYKPRINIPDQYRRLRIGYISPDFREHSVAHFIEPILTHHDHTSFEVFCYSNMDHADYRTRRLQDLADHWETIRALTDTQVEEQVRRDEIDILVDLAGHTSGNRLTLFARKPAPVQLTYLGYPNTTGTYAIDYRLTDCWADPVGQTENLHTEKLIRLPKGFLCYLPPGDAPSVGPLPQSSIGYVTFGSFNHASKITQEVIDVWAKILHQLPDSRLIVKNRSFTDEPTREHYQSLFEARGIEHERVELLGQTPSRSEHLAVYGRIDIALDTFPYNGTTTTCESLWMGVPVIVLAGKVHAGLVGVSLLNQINLKKLIATSTDEYISITTELADDPVRLKELRTKLRHIMETSPLCNASEFTSNLEDNYRHLWRLWCKDKVQDDS